MGLGRGATCAAAAPVGVGFGVGVGVAIAGHHFSECGVVEHLVHPVVVSFLSRESDHAC